MNLKFARAGKTVIYKIIKMTVMSQKDLILNPKNWSRIATLWQRLQQSFRLMVGCLTIRLIWSICGSIIRIWKRWMPKPFTGTVSIHVIHLPET